MLQTLTHQRALRNNPSLSYTGAALHPRCVQTDVFLVSDTNSVHTVFFCCAVTCSAVLGRGRTEESCQMLCQLDGLSELSLSVGCSCGREFSRRVCAIVWLRTLETCIRVYSSGIEAAGIHHQLSRGPPHFQIFPPKPVIRANFIILHSLLLIHM